MSVQHRSPGDPLKIKASEWNSIARVVNSAISQGMSQVRGGVKVATCLVPKSVVAHRGIAIDPTPIASDLSPSKVIYKYNSSPNNPSVQSLIGVVLTTPDQYSGDLVPVQVAVGGQVESRITIPAETTPLFATFGGNGTELIASATPSRIRIVWTEGGVGSFKKALLDIDFGLPLLSQSFATFETAMQTPNIDSVTPSGASGLSYATNLSNATCQLERMGLAVDIGERTQGTYDEECSTTGCAESVSFEYNGSNAVAIDKGLRVYLADECRGAMQEYTDIATGETRQGGDAKFVGGGLLIPFPDPLEEVTGISTSGLAVRLRDGNIGACSVHYDGTKRTSCGGLIIAPDDLCDAESYQGLDVMKATECNFGTMMPGKALEIDESVTTDPTTGQTITTRNLGVVNVKVCGQSGLIINADNEIEYTGGGGGGSSITPCQCSGQWLSNGIFGVKVAGKGECYNNQLNALIYSTGCYYNESGTKIGSTSGVLSVLIDPKCGLALSTNYKSIQVKPDNTTIGFNGSGELTLLSSSSLEPCGTSGLWKTATEFGVKVAGGVGNCYNNMTNALTYVSGCYYDEAGKMLGSTSGVLAVLVDKNCGLDVGTSNQALKVRVDQTTIGYGLSGELTALTGISSVVQASGVPEEGQNGWVTTMYHPMLYHCGTDAIISYRQLMRVADGKLEVSHQRAFVGGNWQEYFGA